MTNPASDQRIRALEAEWAEARRARTAAFRATIARNAALLQRANVALKVLGPCFDCRRRWRPIGGTMRRLTDFRSGPA